MSKLVRGKIRLGQLNTARAYAWTVEANLLLNTQNLDVLLLQEPYAQKGEVKGLNLTDNIVYAVAGSDAPGTCIITKKSITTMLVGNLSNEYCTVVQVQNGLLSLYIVNIYFKFNHAVSDHLQHLDEVIRHLAGKMILIAGDVNSKSILWHSKDTDANGDQLEDFIIEHNLTIHNQPGQPYTFENVHGRSNIDVTLTKGSVGVTNWVVHEALSSSDHRLITYDICSGCPPDTAGGDDINTAMPIRFDMTKANWPSFKQVLICKATTIDRLTISTIEDVDEYVKILNDTLMDACMMSIPCRSANYPPNSKELPRSVLDIRRDMRNLWHTIKRNKTLPKTPLIREYKAARNKYKAAIREYKRRSFEEFVKRHSTEPWGPVYRAIKTCNQNWLKNVVDPRTGETCLDIKESVGVIMDTLFPRDDTTLDSDCHTEMRIAALTYNEPDDSPFGEEEVLGVINTLKNNKAAGLDSIPPEAVKHSAEVMVDYYTYLFNKCLTLRYFPKVWREARLVLLKKQGIMDNTPKAYRPISLLSVLSKVLEGLLINRIMSRCGDYLSDRQCGFMPGKSTVDAVQRVVNFAKNSTYKYVLMVSLDISGAFDNAWWPSVSAYLAANKCPGNLHGLLASFFEGRSCRYMDHNLDIRKVIERGCPQGSKSGPRCWNFILDSLLKSMTNTVAELVSYADDTALLIQANSRKDLELTANNILNDIVDWGQKHKLDFNPNKTECILLKGTLAKTRYPSIKMLSKSVKYSSTIKYLGVMLDDKLNFGPHFKYIADKAKTRMNIFRKIAKEDYGLSSGALNIIYKGVFEAICTYCAPVIARHMNLRNVAYLQKAQRKALLIISHSYSTVPTEALPVLAGMVPIDLLIMERAEKYYKTCTEGPEIYRANTCNKWRSRWSEVDKGRPLYEYIPNPSVRMDLKLQLGHNVVQFLTEHGGSLAYLKRFHPRKVQDSTCLCGTKDQTFNHILEECCLFNEERQDLINHITNIGLPWPCSKPNYIINQDIFKPFKEFCNVAVEKLKAVNKPRVIKQQSINSNACLYDDQLLTNDTNVDSESLGNDLVQCTGTRKEQ